MTTAQVEGYRAFQDNIEEDDNPYERNTEEYELWEEGWYEAYHEWCDIQDTTEWQSYLANEIP